MRKLFLTAILIIMVLVLCSCVSTSIGGRDVESDIIGESFYIYGDEFMGGETYSISPSQNIKDLKILKSDLDTDIGEGSIFFSLTIEEDDFILSGEFKTEYLLDDNNKWRFSSLSRATKDSIKKELKLSMSDADIKENLSGLTIDNFRNLNSRWIIVENEIDSFEIIKRNTDLIKGTDKIIATIVLKDSINKVTGEIEINCVYSYSEVRGWMIKDVKKASDKPFKVEVYNTLEDYLIKESLVGKTIREVYYINEIEYKWEFEKEDILEFNILERNSDIENGLDEILCNVKLEKKNITVQGKMKINYKYNKANMHWELINIKRADDEFEYSYIVKPLEAEFIKNDLIGVELRYGNWGSEKWMIETGEIDNFKITQRFVAEYGSTELIYAHIKLTGRTKVTIEGDLKIVIKLQDNNMWKREGLKRVEDFTKTELE
jgi:hypothetical protein